MAYHRKHGVRTNIARIFNTYGPRMKLNDGRVVPAFMDQALRGEPMTVFGDGSQTRSFCYVSDLVDGLYRLMLSDERYPVNLGNPVEMTILEFAGKIRAPDRKPVGDRLPPAAARTIPSSASPTSPKPAPCSAGSRGFRSTRVFASPPTTFAESNPPWPDPAANKERRLPSYWLLRNRAEEHYLLMKRLKQASRSIMDNRHTRKLLKTRWSKPEELDIYRTQTEAFRKKFGRDMGPDDPFFFDPDADTPQFRRPGEVNAALDLLAMLMGQAGVDAAAIYAFKKTGGLFPTGAGAFTDEELIEWNAAVYEYNEKLRRTGTN